MTCKNVDRENIIALEKHALRGNRTPGGSKQVSHKVLYGNDPDYHYPINAYTFAVRSTYRAFDNANVR